MQGLGTPAVHTVGVLGDGARGIWERVRPFLGLSGIEVLEIVDIFPACEHRRTVGRANFATDAEVAAWVEPR